jgi:amino acid transporter
MKTWNSQALNSEEYVPKTMPKTVGTFEMFMIVMLYMFTITNPVSAISVGVASLTYWIIGGIVFFFPTVIAAVQLAVMFPHEGSTYVWTHKALGGFWSFFATITFWLPGMLVMIGFASTATSLIQGINSAWLTEPWQQGLLAAGLLVLATIISLQRFRILLYLVNMATIITYCIVLLVGLTAVAWLLTGHHPAVSFAAPNWGMNAGNFGLFGTVLIAYLGIDAPLILGGERKPRLSVPRALLWSSAAIIAAYLIVSFALLAVEGPQAASQLGNFSVIAVVAQVFGKPVADIAIVGTLFYFPIFLALNGSIFARLLMTTSIDRRLPISMARLNKHRVPANAVIFQTVAMIIFIAVAFLLPYVLPLGNPADLNNEVLTITLSMMTLVWSISSVFLFIDLLIFYLRDPQAFSRKCIFPMPVLWFCIIVAPIACVVAVIITLSYSPLPQIPVDQWKFIVGGLTFMCLIICATVSLYATSEASWQDQVSEVDNR